MLNSRLILALLVSLLAQSTAQADVVVVANQSDRAVAISLRAGQQEARTAKLAAGDMLPIPTLGTVKIAWQSAAKAEYRTLAVNCVYRFTNTEEGTLEFSQIEVPTDDQTSRGTGVAKAATLDALVTVPVKILVDEDERGARAAWEKRLRARIAAASELLEKQCRIRLEVVAVGQWESDNRINDFPSSLAEFEREVDRDPARLAIGFTSQYEVPVGQTHLGGTRGILHSHILIREWSQIISEAERLEVLVHELGHYLGAAHSNDPNSVMRPSLGDRKSLAKSFRVGFDPVNTLAVNLVSQEMAAGHLNGVAHFSSGTKARLKQIYAWQAESFPADPAAKGYLELVHRAALAEVVLDTRHVIERITRAASANAALPIVADAGGMSRREGDELTEYYLRQAAWAAKELESENREAAFVLAVAVALEDSDILLKNPVTGDFCKAVETPDRRAQRLAVLGTPTMGGRRDLARHFVLSAMLTVTSGPTAAEAAGVAKELLDATRSGGSGFSFVDLAADLAGIRFAQSALAKQLTLLHLADEFSVAFYLPALDGLPEGLELAKFNTEFGSPTDPRYLQVVGEIRQRLSALPPYRPALVTPTEVKPTSNSQRRD